MAFKPITKDSVTSYVSLSDPAIDWEAMAGGDDAKRAENIQALADAAAKHPADAEKLMKFRDGQQPTRFILGPIDPVEMNRIQDECGSAAADNIRYSELRWRAFLASVRRIENFPGVKMNGKGVDQDWIREEFSRGLRSVALEVGMVGWRWNQLTDDEIRL